MTNDRKRKTPEDKAEICDRIQSAIDSGVKVDEACHAEGISNPTFYTWRKELSTQQKPTSQLADPVIENTSPPPVTDDLVGQLISGEFDEPDVADVVKDIVISWTQRAGQLNASDSKAARAAAELIFQFCKELRDAVAS